MITFLVYYEVVVGQIRHCKVVNGNTCDISTAVVLTGLEIKSGVLFVWDRDKLSKNAIDSETETFKKWS